MVVKVTETSILAIVSTPSNSVTVGSAVDVSTWLSAQLRIRFGRATASAFTRAPSCRIEVSYLTSPTADDWAGVGEFQMAVGASIGSQAVSGTEAAGQTVISLAAGTNFAAGDYVFFHNPTIGNSEWARVVSIAGADITIEEGIVNAQTGATCRDQAEQYVATLDLTSVQRLRVVIDGQGSGQAVIAEVVAGAVTAI